MGACEILTVHEDMHENYYSCYAHSWQKINQHGYIITSAIFRPPRMFILDPAKESFKNGFSFPSHNLKLSFSQNTTQRAICLSETTYQTL